jgi:hypothetical protein
MPGDEPTVNEAPRRWTSGAALLMTGALAFYLIAAGSLSSLLRTYGWLRQVALLVLGRGG